MDRRTDGPAAAYATEEAPAPPWLAEAVERFCAEQARLRARLALAAGAAMVTLGKTVKAIVGLA
jgi:hypothetical protein